MAAAILLVRPAGPSEPHYQGKPLTHWIHVAFGSYGGRKQEPGRQAVKAIGTNALPYLMYHFLHEPSPWNKRINRWSSKSRFLKAALGERPDLIQTAGKGLYLLDTNAASVLPQLAPYLYDPVRGGQVASLMRECGEMGLPYLIQACASTNQLVVDYAGNALALLTRTTERAFPPLLALATHTNTGIRMNAIHYLQQVKTRTDLLMPVLLAGLSDTNFGVRMNAAGSLTERGNEAKAAVPGLLRLLNDPNPGIAFNASNALLSIDPAALSPLKAPVGGNEPDGSK